MKEEIKVPPMGESITEAIVGTLIKPSGSTVQVDDEVLELETDKVNQVLYAKASGILTLQVKPGDTVKIGQVVGFVDAEAKQSAAPMPKRETVEEKKSKSRGPFPPSQGIRYGKEAFLAEIGNVDQNDFPSPLPVEKLHAPALSPEEATPPRKTNERETRRKMTQIRKVIANRLVEAQQATAMLTTFNEVDCSAIMAVREKYRDFFQKKHGVKLGLMSFFVKAVVSALRAVPELNSYIDKDEIVHREYFDIGIAVGTDRGLIVPVLRNCEQLSFAEIEKEIENYAKKAREGRLAMDDLQGGGFTITNGGIYGSLLSTPILNPPQSGILGMHKIEKRAVVMEDQIVIRPMMYVALSYDHRIVDGKEAVSFLVHVKNALEDPSRLLIEV
ncbi:2-oxoglutarate dehydrogenase complex dihydrolipoyllysine-residue succinyltransferase [Parachlamydia sp. AcF125]|uniref:2-oxoglutarate dehydrogenase complex dihydrolipoyllysine-residue succinyltransferase n=1 Tax=Parachlamydia sp. AcF125 TaxID=2795736 RepID=UPI001BCA289A|nr:2-oxoglutarate dehydrogenase complex dihydrolipoyllysine-residue succinyltransferase [Parachlamydia sp. AcF125]MBS4168583.1 Dihydrolipoyllysine-residue succinyltransferase component of 2-oxoglutarate dehydrogenase complex [Parachlamydia sp. AcF125]